MAVIVLTGGPCGGKSSVIEAIRHEMSSNRRVICMSEVATSLLRERDYDLSQEGERIRLQEDIFERQLDAENRMADEGRLLIVDRGLLDGSVYWPGGIKAWCRHFGLSREDCCNRYSRVIHLESLALGRMYETNDVRTESRDDAARLDREIERVWRNHKNRHIFLAGQSLREKIDLLKIHINFALRKCEIREYTKLVPSNCGDLVKMGLLSPAFVSM